MAGDGAQAGIAGTGEAVTRRGRLSWIRVEIVLLIAVILLAACQ